MLLWSRAVAPGLDPFTTVHLDRLTAEGFAELGVQIGHDDLGSLEGSMFYRLSEFTFITMFLNFMNYFSITKIDDFTNLSFITDLNFVYARAFSMNDSGTRVEFMPDPEGDCLGFHCPCILQTAFTHICSY